MAKRRNPTEGGRNKMNGTSARGTRKNTNGGGPGYSRGHGFTPQSNGEITGYTCPNCKAGGLPTKNAHKKPSGEFICTFKRSARQRL